MFPFNQPKKVTLKKANPHIRFGEVTCLPCGAAHLVSSHVSVVARFERPGSPEVEPTCLPRGGDGFPKGDAFKIGCLGGFGFDAANNPF